MLPGTEIIGGYDVGCLDVLNILFIFSQLYLRCIRVLSLCA